MTTPASDIASPSASPGNLTCEQAAMLYCDSRDRRLSAAETTQLQAHIDRCRPCSIASAQLAALFQQLDSLLAGEE